MASLADLLSQYQQLKGSRTFSEDVDTPDDYWVGPNQDQINPKYQVPQLSEFLEQQGYFAPNVYNIDPSQDWGAILPNLTGGAAQTWQQGLGQVYPIAAGQNVQQAIQPYAQPEGRFSWDRLKPFAMMGTAMLGGALAGGAGAGAGTAAGGSAAFIPAEGAGGLAALGETALPAVGAGVTGAGALGAGAGAGGAGGAAGMTAAEQAALLSAEGPVSASVGLGGTGPVTAESVTGSTALGRLLGLDQTGQDLLSVGGGLLPGILGYLGAGQQSDAYRDVANQYFNIGAPFRSTLEASYQPDFSLIDQPGYGDALSRTADISARAWGSRLGNPSGSPAAQAQILQDVFGQNYLPALASYRGQLGQFGGLGLNTAGAGSLGGAGVAGGGLDAIGLGLGRLMTPPNPYEQILKQYALTVGGTRV